MEKKEFRSKRAAICTLGCKVNQYESEAMAELLCAAGYEIVPFEETADCYLINTCTVTSLSDRKSRQMIRRAIRKNPQATVAVSGCYAQTAPEEIQKIPGVDLILGTDRRAELVELLERAKQQPLCVVEDIGKQRLFEPLRICRYGKDRVRAFLKIQDGCDNYCTYCKIPYARGHVRSREKEDILQEVRALEEHGIAEIVLAGIQLSSYRGSDGSDLTDLLRELSALRGIRRIRLGSLEPGVVTEEFVRTVSSIEGFCPQFHLSLQSGCDETLRRMNRHYTAQDYREAVGRLRSAFCDPAITTDVMVGFSGETEEEFRQSYEFVRKTEFARIHVFPYSVREGTRAASLPDPVSPQEKERRAAEMIRLGTELSERFVERWNGRETTVLAEREISPGLFEGYTPEYLRIRIRSDRPLIGQIVPVTLSLQGAEPLSDL